MRTITHRLARLAVMISFGALGAGCGQATDVTDESASGETIPVSTYDGKSDSLRTHELELTIDKRREFHPEGWGPDIIFEWHPLVEITDHSDDHVSVTTDELIFRPPADIADQHGQGWMTFLNRARASSIGTSFSIMIWWRPVDSGAEWTPVEMPPGDEGRDMGRYFQAFGVEEGEEPEFAMISEVPDGRCELVLGHSSGSDQVTFDSEHRLPELDDDGAIEFRLVVVPNFNFCEWSEKSWSPEVIVTPINTGYWNTA